MRRIVWATVLLYVVLVGSVFGEGEHVESDTFTALADSALRLLDGGSLDAAMDLWERGHDKGYFFLLSPRIPQFKALAENERFAAISERDLALRDSVNAISHAIYRVVPPSGIDSSKSYPLMIVLHGGGSSLERAMSYWKSSTQETSVITLFIQSYLHYSSVTFGWRRGDEKAHDEISRIYREVVSQYPVDTSCVILAGVSAGGVMAFDMVAVNTIPLCGILGVCPGHPESLTSETARPLAERGCRVAIVAGETDHYRPQQETLTAVLDSAGVHYQSEIVPGMGHGIPDDFSDWLDGAIGFVVG